MIASQPTPRLTDRKRDAIVQAAITRAQPIVRTGLAAMLGAFADREDAGVVGRQAVIDDNAAVDGEAGGPGEINVRPHADGDDDQIVPIETTARAVKRLLPSAILKVYEGAPHGLSETHKDRLNQDMLAFLKA